MIKKWKKTKIILSMVLITSIVAAFSFAKEDQILKRISVHGDMISYEEMKDLEGMADLVVIGEPTADFINRDHIIKTGEDESIEDFYSNTEIKIHEVLLNNDQSNYHSGDLLSIIEPSSVIEEERESFEFVMDEYTSVNKEAGYIFFLKKNTFGEYSLIGNQLGKFNIDGNDHRDLAINSESLSDPEDILLLEETFDVEKLDEEFDNLLKNTQDGMHTESEQHEELQHSAEKKLSFYVEITEKYDESIDNYAN
ncbi:hypothetical protein [Planococcus maritimus]|uniref:hypothetical protein n=1 Tax=Planococcus maritimus TaxID=192421 RepID=UPI00079BD82E|nr:hypothetical protein [Planococcus maritimus]ANU17136.1 hypothetical protein BBI11_08960 [Planococcus maritimus]KYG58665.1 hypothetical protein AY633_00015 [Planococcus maritimus]